MGWFWANSSNTISDKPSGCPVNHEGAKACPVDHGNLSSNRAASKPPSGDGCPVDHTSRNKWLARGPDRQNNDINPLNNMPNLSIQRAPGQKVHLPTERTASTIPKGVKGDEGVWEYPSPQQMLNAMLRKGGEVPEDAVESMVDVHNFLNEGAWKEILQWEQYYTEESQIAPRLLKFTGRPHDMTPRAQYYQFLRKLFPSQYGNAPFDRHDWTVLRHSADSQDSSEEAWRPVRYVIDYYAGPDDSDGMPTFFLDVRPALDSFESVKDRAGRAAQNLWDRAMRSDA